VLVVVALGGNAFNRPGDPITQETHLKNADIAARIVAKIVQEGNQVLLTHGNGPQVGYLAELQKGREGFKLDALVAATQGLLGYFLVSSLDKYVGRGKPWLSDLLAALGCPVGGSLVPPIGRGFIRHLGGGRGGRSSSHVKSPGATPQATTHVPLGQGV